MTHTLPPSHAPQGTGWQTVVQAYLDPWLEYRKQRERFVPKYVEAEFRESLECRNPEWVGMTVACPAGHYSRSYPARCKGRGFCAYCLTLRQRQVGSRLIDEVIGNVPVRHHVLCFPPCVRFTLGYDARLIKGGFGALTSSVFAYQRRRAMELFKVPRDRIHSGCAAVTHPASANLKPNHHFHGIFPDGVFIEVEPGQLEFRRLPAPSEEDIAGIAHQAGLTFCKAMKACGFWKGTSTSSDAIEGVLELPGTRSTPAKFFGEAAKYGEGGTESRDGAYPFHLFVSKAIEVRDRPQLQDLVKYILAPPFRDDQVSLDEAGNVRLEFKRERRDGTGREVVKPFEFLDRLADLVPRPNTNSLRYYGIYGARARLRKAAVALRLEGSRPAKRCRVELKECPICGQELRVINEGRACRRMSEAIPPDTPQGLIPGGKGGQGDGADHGVQGRLLLNTG